MAKSNLKRGERIRFWDGYCRLWFTGKVLGRVRPGVHSYRIKVDGENITVVDDVPGRAIERIAV